MERFGVTEAYDYNATHKRHKIHVWSGTFSDTWEGVGLSTKTGYMISTYHGDKVRVTCPTPRGEDNYREVDAAVSAAMTAHFNEGDASR